MCRGSRMETAISAHSSVALMMMAVDLLCSAFWTPEPEGFPQHAVVYTVAAPQLLDRDQTWLTPKPLWCTEGPAAFIQPFRVLSRLFTCKELNQLLAEKKHPEITKIKAGISISQTQPSTWVLTVTEKQRWTISLTAPPPALTQQQETGDVRSYKSTTVQGE